MAEFYREASSLDGWRGTFMTRILPIALLFGAAILNGAFLFFGNSSVFPLGVFDGVFFAVLFFFFALYRPGWAFLVFLAVLPFEIVNLAPEVFPVSIRPYQLFGAAILGSLLVRFVFRRHSFPFVSFRWFDALVLVFIFGSLASLFFAPDLSIAGKQTAAVVSSVGLYVLSREFLNTANDARRVIPFLVLSALGTILFALWQSARFTAGLPSFEVMAGRPNAFFSEPDWLGMYLICAGSLALTSLFLFLERKCSRREEALGMHNNEFGKKAVGDVERHSDVSHTSFSLLLSSLFLCVSFLGLLLTVARSAWVGFFVSLVIFLKLLLFQKYGFIAREWRWGLLAQGVGIVSLTLSLALFVVWTFRLTTFELSGRAGSAVSGFQEITVSCGAPVSLPEKIGNVSDLFAYGCRHIRLEEIELERRAEKFVTTILRPDPSIEARRLIREKTFLTLRENWVLGIGWGNIGSVLGTDDRGARYNASNAFLEVWLGGGILSFLSFLALWVSIPFLSVRSFFAHESGSDARAVAVFFLVSWGGCTVFNFFNSGILLGFVWVWLGSIGMLLSEKKLCRFF